MGRCRGRCELPCYRPPRADICARLNHKSSSRWIRDMARPVIPHISAAATLLLEALSRLPITQRPQLWFEQSDNIAERGRAVAAINEHFGYVGWPETLRQSVYFDANKKLRNGGRAYDYVGQVLRIHASQWPRIATGEERADAPASERLIPLAPVSNYAPGDYCTKLKLSRPTFDIPGNKERLGLTIAAPAFDSPVVRLPPKTDTTEPRARRCCRSGSVRALLMAHSGELRRPRDPVRTGGG